MHINDKKNHSNVHARLHSILQQIPSATEEITSKHLHTEVVERTLGETEASYFLPWRESGVNDMYLHLGCRAPAHLVERRRVSVVWAIMHVRHPLLASKVEMHNYQDIRFTYTVPLSSNEALDIAASNLEYRMESKDELIDAFLNGPRTLSNGRLSYLVVSSDDKGQDRERNYDFLICATHFVSDGTALNSLANDFFGLLGSTLDDKSLEEKLSNEWSERCLPSKDMTVTLPSAMEDRLPTAPAERFNRAAASVDFNLSQQRLIGGHAFPRQSRGARRTIALTICLERDTTKKILSNCKARGVSISAALFAICNVAWARTDTRNWELPMLMYSALNMRRSLLADKHLNDSYWFLAIGYFNVVLPTFLPTSGDVTTTFWHRARSAKNQSAKAANNPFTISRSRKELGARVHVWVKEEDDELAGIVREAPAPAPFVVASNDVPPKPKVPSNALMGLSLPGNLDGMYKHAAFPDIKLHTLKFGSRQPPGEMLLFGYTFVQKLWVNFGYDENGFEEDTVKRFWKNVIDAIHEFLI